MTLGQNICRLRSQRGLSQGDLAEELEVSRQSISKWETDTSVPELDKLVKLSALFQVTLDELVTGKKPEQFFRLSLSRKQIITGGAAVMVALALVGLARMYSWIQVLTFTMTLAVGALVCYAFPERRKLWAGWTALFVTEFALTPGMYRYMADIFGPRVYQRLKEPFRWSQYFSEEQKQEAAARFALNLGSSWVMFLWMSLMVGLTLYSFRRAKLPARRRLWQGTALGCGLLAALTWAATPQEELYWPLLNSLAHTRLIILTTVLIFLWGLVRKPKVQP